jgi:acetyl-CoA decarbonylase/synthase, CODH/ACS complex subunit delta
METVIDRYRSKIVEVTFGSRNRVVVGGDQSLALHGFEADGGLKQPVLAMEVTIGVPEWPGWLLETAGAQSDTVSWAKNAVAAGAGAVCVSLSADREDAQVYAAEVSEAVSGIIKEVGLPVMVSGSGNRELDNAVVPSLARSFAGERLLLGTVTQENYDIIAQACLEHGHAIIAQSPIDINICKQLNILLTERGIPLENIVIDPTTGGLGYGIEYTYSIMEKARLAALAGDRMLSCPQVCFIGAENWKLKEASSTEEGLPDSWGDRTMRGVEWEAIAAASLVVAGASLLVMRSPLAMSRVASLVGRFSSGN